MLLQTFNYKIQTIACNSDANGDQKETKLTFANSDIQ